MELVGNYDKFRTAVAIALKYNIFDLFTFQIQSIRA
jgi:hypothetical protein